MSGKRIKHEEFSRHHNDDDNLEEGGEEDTTSLRVVINEQEEGGSTRHFQNGIIKFVREKSTLLWMVVIGLTILVCLGLLLGFVIFQMWNTPQLIDDDHVQQEIGFNKTVIMVSLDGFRPDYLEMFGEECGNLTSIIRKGIRAQSMSPIFPSKTFPNHYTLVTGLYAESHGIVSNTFWDPNFKAKFSMGSYESFKSRWWLGEPIWVTAEKQGKVSGSFFWPGSDVEIQGMYPTYYQKYDGRITYETRVKTVFEWLDSDKPPQIVLTYFSSVDSVGHNLGPIYSESLRKAVKEVDNAVGLILQGLEQRNMTEKVDLIVVSDHGMSPTPKSKIVRLTDILGRNVLDGVDVLNMNAGPFLDMYISNKTMIDSLYNELTTSINNNPNFTQAIQGVFTKSNMPERFHFKNSDRVPDIIVLGNPEYSVLRNGASQLSTKGTHGYDNLATDMGSLFIAQGRHFKKGFNSENQVRNLDIYSLVCKLLDLIPAPNNGTAENFASYLRDD